MLLYILVTYIIIKIVTAIVIKSIKEAQEKVRSKQGPGGLGNLLGAGGKFLGSLKKKGDKKKGGDKKK